MSDMGRHNLLNGHRGEDGAAVAPAIAPKLAPFVISPALEVQRLAPVPQPAPPPEAQQVTREWTRNLRDSPWPLLIIAAPAAVAIWSGWVGLGEMCGFGPIRPLPGIAPAVVINTAITLPVGVEAYGAYALAVWLGAKRISSKTRRWARNSAIGALALGCLGQVAFHLLSAARWLQAPWPVVTAVSCLPVVSLALAAALAHMIRADVRSDLAADSDDSETPPEVTAEITPEVSPGPPVQVTPEPVSGQVPGQPEPPTPEVPQVRPRRKVQAKPARISDTDLKDEIRSALAAGTPPTVSAVAKKLGRGRDRVRPLLEEVRSESPSSLRHAQKEAS